MGSDTIYFSQVFYKATIEPSGAFITGDFKSFYVPELAQNIF